MKYSGNVRFSSKISVNKSGFIIPIVVTCLLLLFSSLTPPEENNIMIGNPERDTIPAPAEDTSSVYVVVEEMPVFPGGIDSLTSYLTQKIVYPREALVDRAEGTVYVSFVINTNGSTGKIKTIKGIHKSLDRVAIEAVRGMPHWKPGMIKGKRVRTQINLPIRFMLPVSE